MTIEDFKTLALSFPYTLEQPHFNRVAFKIDGKQIFSTLHEDSETANIKLSVDDQQDFSSLDKAAIYPVPNKWGEKGWTTFELTKLQREVIFEALSTAYNRILSKK